MKDIPYIVYETEMWYHKKIVSRLSAVITIQSLVIVAGCVLWILLK